MCETVGSSEPIKSMGLLNEDLLLSSKTDRPIDNMCIFFFLWRFLVEGQFFACVLGMMIASDPLVI